MRFIAKLETDAELKLNYKAVLASLGESDV